MKTINTLLISPSYSHIAKKFPLGIAYLSAFLKKHQKAVHVLDLSVDAMSHQDLCAMIDQRNISLVGITARTSQIYSAWELARIIKMHSNNINIVLGGAHVSALPHESLEKENVDFVVMGEGEQTLLELVEALEGKRSISSVHGLGYKESPTQPAFTPRREYIADLDALPFPERDDFPGFPQKYTSPTQYYQRYADILTSRGCPFHCTFCANKATLGDVFRAKSPEKVVEEIIFLKNHYGIKDFHIADDNFTFDRARAIKICQLITEQDLHIKLACANGVHVNTIDEELVKYMKHAGVYRVGIGIESGNQQILKKIGKTIKLEQVTTVVKLFKKHGILTVGFFMLGNLHENEQTMNDTIDFAISLPLDFAYFGVMVPYPGTPAFRYLQRHQALLSMDWHHFCFQKDRLVFRTEEISQELMSRMYARAHRRFYYRPAYVTRRLVGALTHIHECKLAFRGFKTILGRHSIENG